MSHFVLAPHYYQTTPSPFWASLDVTFRNSSSTSKKSSGGGHENSRIFPECGCLNLGGENDNHIPNLEKHKIHAV